MPLAAIDQRSHTRGRAVIPVRGHRFRDWIARLGKRPSFEGLENPPRSKRVRADDHLRIEISLPGFRARDVDVVCEEGCIAITARRILVEGTNRSESRVAQLVMSLDDHLDTANGAAKIRNGSLVVRLPLKESAKVRRIPIRVR